eukprot:6211071-Lingulodinium_polyedra.AAC.1
MQIAPTPITKTKRHLSGPSRGGSCTENNPPSTRRPALALQLCLLLVGNGPVQMRKRALAAPLN